MLRVDLSCVVSLPRLIEIWAAVVYAVVAVLVVIVAVVDAGGGCCGCIVVGGGELWTQCLLFDVVLLLLRLPLLS